MRVFTPSEVSRNAGSKYLGVLVAAKYARELNALPAGRRSGRPREEADDAGAGSARLGRHRVPPHQAAPQGRVTSDARGARSAAPLAGAPRRSRRHRRDRDLQVRAARARSDRAGRRRGRRADARGARVRRPGHVRGAHRTPRASATFSIPARAGPHPAGPRGRCWCASRRRPRTSWRVPRLGRADDLLTAVLLATTAPVLLCPAMNDRMWAHAQTQANVRHLRRRLGLPDRRPGRRAARVRRGRRPGPHAGARHDRRARRPRARRRDARSPAARWS